MKVRWAFVFATLFSVSNLSDSQAFACAAESTPQSYGFNADEFSYSYAFSSNVGRALRVVFKTGINFNDTEDNQFVDGTTKFSPDASSLKVCSATLRPEIETAKIFTCCGRELPNVEFEQIPGSNCVYLHNLTYPNSDYRLEVTLKDGDVAVSRVFIAKPEEKIDVEVPSI